MQTATASFTPETTAPDYAGWNLSALIEEYYRVKIEIDEIVFLYNEHFVLDPAYTREHKRILKPYEDKMTAITDALMPFYLMEIELGQRERSFKGQGVAA